MRRAQLCGFAVLALGVAVGLRPTHGAPTAAGQVASLVADPAVTAPLISEGTDLPVLFTQDEGKRPDIDGGKVVQEPKVEGQPKEPKAGGQPKEPKQPKEPRQEERPPIAGGKGMQPKPGEPGAGPGQPGQPGPMGCGYMECTVIRYQQVWKEKEVKYTVHKPVMREEQYTYKVYNMVPKVQEREHKYTVYNQVPKVVEQTVTRCQYVPVMCQTCCGCFTSYQPVMVQDKVQCTVYETVPEVKVQKYQVQTFEQKIEERKGTRQVCDWKAEEVTQKVKYCEMVPVQEKIQVPVAPPVCYPSYPSYPGCYMQGGYGGCPGPAMSYGPGYMGYGGCY